jgi:hypothetical protein
MAKRGRKHTHDGVDIIVEPERAAENIWICAVRAAPQAITDDSCRSETESEIFGTKKASHLRRCAEHRKVVGADDEQFKTLWLFGAGQIGTHRPDYAYFLEDTRSGLEILELGYGEWNVPHADSRITKSDLLEPIRIAERERAQQDSIHNTEDGGIGADA